MNWYLFTQANSGGYMTAPAVNIAILADDYEQANELALSRGAYFDGCAAGKDCQCCGDRWRRVGPEKCYEGTPKDIMDATAWERVTKVPWDNVGCKYWMTVYEDGEWKDFRLSGGAQVAPLLCGH